MFITAMVRREFSTTTPRFTSFRRISIRGIREQERAEKRGLVEAWDTR